MGLCACVIANRVMQVLFAPMGTARRRSSFTLLIIFMRRGPGDVDVCGFTANSNANGLIVRNAPNGSLRANANRFIIRKPSRIEDYEIVMSCIWS